MSFKEIGLTVLVKPKGQGEAKRGVTIRKKKNPKHLSDVSWAGLQGVSNPVLGRPVD